jgi:hypothetical protein
MTHFASLLLTLAEDGYYDSAEETALPVTFTVPAGDYTVVIAQGNCNTTADITALEDEEVDVTLVLDCYE